jgi:bifunctional non-homologous end joining protein LigD
VTPRAAASVELPSARALGFELTNLEKVFFPGDGYTKGDLLRYYTAVAPAILPAIRDRPLALKRYPGGIARPFFFQQNAPAGPPPRVRVEMVAAAKDGEEHPRIVGGTLPTLLYTIQLGCIGVDAWFSHVPTLDTIDYTLIDLDPPEGSPFRRVVAVAHWAKAALDELGLHGMPKTSGATGLHILIPLPPRTSTALAEGVARAVAARVAAAHPREVTLERGIARRGRGAVYMDVPQNGRGKTVAAPYCVRAVPGARVSMPLRWDELTDSLDPREFTIRSALPRIARVGDLWAAAARHRNAAPRVRAAAGEVSVPPARR